MSTRLESVQGNTRWLNSEGRGTLPRFSASTRRLCTPESLAHMQNVPSNCTRARDVRYVIVSIIPSHSLIILVVGPSSLIHTRSDKRYLCIGYVVISLRRGRLWNFILRPSVVRRRPFNNS